MMLYAQTWYQKMFHAMPKNDKKTIRAIQTRITKKPDISFDLLWNRYLSKGYPKNQVDIIHHKFLSAVSWCEFFQEIRSENCQQWQPWINDFFKETFHISLRGTVWIIKPQTSSSLSIEETSSPKLKAKPKYVGLRYFSGGGVIMDWDNLT